MKLAIETKQYNHDCYHRRMSVSTATHLRQACENSREPRSVGEILYSELRANHPVTTQFAQVGCEEHEVEVGTYVPTQQEMDFLAELIR